MLSRTVSLVRLLSAAGMVATTPGSLSRLMTRRLVSTLNCGGSVPVTPLLLASVMLVRRVRTENAAGRVPFRPGMEERSRDTRPAGSSQSLS